MGKFVGKARIAVTDDDGNTIYIRPRMSYGVKNAVMDAAMQVRSGQNTAMSVGAYQNALLLHNILGWEGPDFEGIPCTEEMILDLDPDDPLLERVLREINDRNRDTKIDEKKSTSPGVALPVANPSRGALADGTSRSNVRNAITGRLSK